VRAAHHHGDSGGTDRIGHPICLGNHASHRANADQPNLLDADIICNLAFIHGLGIAIDQQDFMARWRQRLKKKHP